MGNRASTLSPPLLDTGKNVGHKPLFSTLFYLGNMCAAARPLPRTEHLDQGTEAPGCLAQDIGSLVQGIGLGWDTGLGLARLGPSMLRTLGPP